jgi:hypothetical protein
MGKLPIKIVLFMVVLAACSSSQAAITVSPRGAVLFGDPSAIINPPSKKVQLQWRFPASLQTPDMVFKVYRSTNLAIPLKQWALLTNLPATVRMVELPADEARGFFTLTASNYLGESGYATR